jgi:hypothetical protein
MGQKKISAEIEKRYGSPRLRNKSIGYDSIEHPK